MTSSTRNAEQPMNVACHVASAKCNPASECGWENHSPGSQYVRRKVLLEDEKSGQSHNLKRLRLSWHWFHRIADQSIRGYIQSFSTERRFSCHVIHRNRRKWENIFSARLQKNYTNVSCSHFEYFVIELFFMEISFKTGTRSFNSYLYIQV